jgi:hypothetical protein
MGVGKRERGDGGAGNGSAILNRAGAVHMF